MKINNQDIIESFEKINIKKNNIIIILNENEKQLVETFAKKIFSEWITNIDDAIKQLSWPIIENNSIFIYETINKRIIQ